MNVQEQIDKVAQMPGKRGMFPPLLRLNLWLSLYDGRVASGIGKDTRRFCQGFGLNGERVERGERVWMNVGLCGWRHGRSPCPLLA